MKETNSTHENSTDKVRRLNHKQPLSFILALLLCFVLVACGGNANGTTVDGNSSATTGTEDEGSVDGTATATPSEDETNGSELELTLDELATYNGKDGQPAYVAVDGIIYDFSDLDKWAGGEHAGQFTAGNDLTEEIDTLSPHGRDVLERAPIVGRLVD